MLLYIHYDKDYLFLPILNYFYLYLIMIDKKQLKIMFCKTRNNKVISKNNTHNTSNHLNY